MQRLVPFLLLGFLALAIPSPSAESVTASAARARFYVSPDGNDSWSGKIPQPNPSRTDGPFASLGKARDAVRQSKERGTEPALVSIRGGIYILSLIDDPRFADPEKGDFSLPPDSPALKIGIKPIDLSEVGPRER